MWFYDDNSVHSVMNKLISAYVFVLHYSTQKSSEKLNFTELSLLIANLKSLSLQGLKSSMFFGSFSPLYVPYVL